MFLESNTMLLIQWGTVFGTSLIAALYDLKSHRIPNALTFPVLIAGFIFATVTSGAIGFLDALAGCFLLALPYVLLFIFAGGGAGDAKLMAAIGAWLGLAYGAIALVAVSILGVLMAFAVSIIQKRFKAVLGFFCKSFNSMLILVYSKGKIKKMPPKIDTTNEKLMFPYGLSIFMGVTVAAVGVLIWNF